MFLPCDTSGQLESFQKGKNAGESLERFEEYLKVAKSVFKTEGITTDEEMKNMLQVWGGDDMRRLFENTGEVNDVDTFEEAIKKIINGLKSMINNVYPMCKLFQGMPQGEQQFSDWVPQVLKQAHLCSLDDYTPERAARDAIVMQTSNAHLRKIVFAEGTSYDKLVKLGCALDLESMENSPENSE